MRLLTDKLKKKMDVTKRYVQFKVVDLVMAHMNKARFPKVVPHKLHMRGLGPCKILEKYGNNAYKVELPEDIGLSPIFNVVDFISYKGFV